MAKARRGSQKLPARIRKADIDRLLTSAQMDGVRLVEFFPIGIPTPDGGRGVWHVAPGKVGTLLDRVLRDRVAPGIKIFPKGIPRPDLFEVGFEVGSGRAPRA